ncbi:oligosaccharide deacetylase [Reticulibacter mediterranei]|uniref:Oligosaccharide deacetylase n=1 Tax=Reticulibacter mediterranei TaxID=2778369 RepID=A0A8J3N5U3_9CHLR|nr:polysaccharide deacetylase family protein [Reticulibacter mediterranei]GHO99459.1 oligosaccharide deacetylase [Reticulibacter mediterranei]
MRNLRYLLLIAGLLCWEVALQAAILPASMPQPRSDERAAATVALTFDDGPQAIFTPQVLRVLQRYQAPATFFYVGSQVQKNEALVRQTYQEGDVIGDHSWNHPNLTTLSPAAIRWQLRATSVVIQQATGVAPTLFRPPYGATNTTVRNISSQLGLTQILWTTDTHDWQRPGVASIVSAALRAHNGSIILMHDGGGDRSQTVQALPQIISELRQRGFTFIAL